MNSIMDNLNGIAIDNARTLAANGFRVNVYFSVGEQYGEECYHFESENDALSFAKQAEEIDGVDSIEMRHYHTNTTRELFFRE